jgi:hypothetical protein
LTIIHFFDKILLVDAKKNFRVTSKLKKEKPEKSVDKQKEI